MCTQVVAPVCGCCNVVCGVSGVGGNGNGGGVGGVDCTMDGVIVCGCWYHCYMVNGVVGVGVWCVVCVGVSHTPQLSVLSM